MEVKISKSKDIAIKLESLHVGQMTDFPIEWLQSVRVETSKAANYLGRRFRACKNDNAVTVFRIK